MKYLSIFLFVALLVSCSTLVSTKCSPTIINRLSQMEATEESREPLNLVDSTFIIWRAMRGCSDPSILCENEKWIIYEQGEGCEVALELNISGRTEVIPMFYIDTKTELVYAVDDPLNLGVPINSIGYFKHYGTNKLP